MIVSDFANRYEVLKWLFDPVEHRCEGRSYLMATVYVDLAWQYGAVQFVDHFGTYRSTRHLVQYIRAVIDKMPEHVRFGFSVNSNQNILKWDEAEAHRGYVDWLMNTVLDGWEHDD